MTIKCQLKLVQDIYSEVLMIFYKPKGKLVSLDELNK